MLPETEPALYFDASPRAPPSGEIFPGALFGNPPIHPPGEGTPSANLTPSPALMTQTPRKTSATDATEIVPNQLQHLRLGRVSHFELPLQLSPVDPRIIPTGQVP